MTQNEWIQKAWCDHTAHTASCFVQESMKMDDGAPIVMWSHHTIWLTWEVMAHMTTLCGIEKCLTMVYHPHTNGLSQHNNHSINEKGKAVAHNQHKWLYLVAVFVWC